MVVFIGLIQKLPCSRRPHLSRHSPHLEASCELGFGNSDHNSGNGPHTPSSTGSPTYSARSIISSGSECDILYWLRPPWECLASHPRVSTAASLALVMGTLATMGFFFASNSGLSVEVVAVLEAGDHKFTLNNLFAFDLLNSVRDMWDAKIYPLALLILVFSGIWPYAKLILMLACLLVPTSRLAPDRRRRFLEFLDAYGKWSLVDTYVLVMFMVGFHFKFTTQDPAIVQIVGNLGIPASMEVQIEPKTGIHYFISATILSLVLGNLICMMHRYSEQIGEFCVKADDGPKQRVCDVVKASRQKVIVVALAICVSLMLLIVGTFIISFRFVFTGITGVLLGDKGSIRDYSVWSLGMSLPFTISDPNAFSIRYIQAVFLLFSFFVVVAYHIAIFILWLVPLSALKQRTLLVTAQTLNAWSAIDVFVLSVITAVLEISQMADFIVGDKCDLISKILKNPPARLRHILPPSVFDVPTCLTLGTNLTSGTPMLFTAAVVCTLLSSILLSRISQALFRQDNELSVSRSRAGTAESGAGVQETQMHSAVSAISGPLLQ